LKAFSIVALKLTTHMTRTEEATNNATAEVLRLAVLEQRAISILTRA
jgi:hypothetical protein